MVLCCFIICFPSFLQWLPETEVLNYLCRCISNKTMVYVFSFISPQYWLFLQVAPPTTLTSHQARVLKSLEKVNIPSWFRPGSHSLLQTNHNRHSPSANNKPSWKTIKETPINSVDNSSDHLTIIARQRTGSRETSTCPSYSSSYSRWSSTHREYRTIRAGSTQSWHPPNTRSYKQPYLGWRCYHPHKEEVPYLLPPPHRLANSAARELLGPERS